MSEIKAGDLVMVVRPTVCCGGTKNIGRVFTAKRVFAYEARCAGCGLLRQASMLVESDVISDTNKNWPYVCFVPSRLIRIDPPALTESTTTDEPLKEYA